MKLDRFFKIASYVLISCGFLTLVLTGRVDFIAGLLYAAGLVLSWRADAPGSKLQISARTANLAVAFYLPFGYIDFRYLSDTWITCLVHFVLFISIFKLFQIKEDRDWVFLYLLAIFEVLLSAGLTIDGFFIVLLAVFVLTGLATLETFEILRTRRLAGRVMAETAFVHDGSQPRPAARPVRYLLATTIGMALFIGLLTVPIFLIMPRFNTGLLSQSFSDTTSSTGFSDMGIDLGGVGEIKLNTRIVMRVKVDTPLPPGTHWRGTAMTFFDGRNWNKAGASRRFNLPPLRPDAYLFANRRPAKPISQIFYLEPISTSAFFYCGEPISARDLRGLSFDETGSIYRTDAGPQTAYTVLSDLGRPTEEKLRRDTLAYSPIERERFLQLPTTFDPRVAELARTVAGNKTNAYDKARAIEEFLRTRFSYNLERNRTNEADPVADFLFNTKAGHCEFFASSMAVMLRSLGIGARLAGGFQTGEYNTVNQTYIVRQSDAHAWVEVYFPETKTWIEFDPTPDAGTSGQPSGIFATLRRYVDAMRVFYLDYVLTYDSQRQRTLARDATQKASEYQSLWRRTITPYQRSAGVWLAQFDKPILAMLRSPDFPRYVGLLIAGLLASVGGVTFYRALRRFRAAPDLLFKKRWLAWLMLPFLRRAARHDARQSAVLFYNEMIDILARAGFKREPHQTPTEFARATGLAEAVELTETYNGLRFGGEPALAPEPLRQRLDTLRAAVRRKKR
jgi:transglutaminase-like putative cysteine protease